MLHALNSTDGKVLERMDVLGAVNHDWEDVAVGPCGADSCIYIADTGDKNSESARNVIYRVKDEGRRLALPAAKRGSRHSGGTGKIT